MSSSRSAASVRAKRAGPQSEQTFGRPSGPGPATSIGSTPIFNSGGNTTGANARIHGTSAKSVPVKETVNPVNEFLNPAPGSKMSVNNAVALITIRLGRLEAFMHQYNLEGPSQAQSQSQSGASSEEMQTVLSRLSDLEHVVAGLKTQTQTQVQGQGQRSSKDTGGGDNLMLVTRINALEKQVSASNASSGVQPVLFNGLKTEVEGVKKTFESFSEEVKELKDMLLRLQTYTMETNAKLVNTMFPLYDSVNVVDFEDSGVIGDNRRAGDNDSDQFLYAQEVDDLCYSEDENNDVEYGEETDRLIDNNALNATQTKNGINITYDENTTTFTPNLKELISQELMNCSRF
jgi:hypothetical protein